MSPLPPLLLGALVSQAAAPSPRVETERDETQIVCSGQLPFSQAEMEEALHARRHLLGQARSVVVRGEGGRARVEVGAAVREVELGGRGGEDAARMVAVLALDLAQAEEPVTVTLSAPAPAPRPSHAQPHRLQAGAVLLTPLDQPGLSAHLEPTLEAFVEVARGLGPFVTVGYRRVTAGADPSTWLEMQELPVRAGVAYQRGWLELRLGALSRSRWVDGAGSHRGVTWGAVAAAGARWALTPKVGLVVAAGLDLARNRVAFAVEHETVLTTSWLAPWLGAGVAWETAL